MQRDQSLICLNSLLARIRQNDTLGSCSSARIDLLLVMMPMQGGWRGDRDDGQRELMMPSNDKEEVTPITKTAYGQQTANEYDWRRFENVHGKVFGGIEEVQLVRVLKGLDSPKTILEVGCGTGRFVQIVAAHGHRILGLDPSPFMLKHAREKLADYEDVSFLEAEGVPLPFPDSKFDMVFSIRTINQLESKAYAMGMIKELIRVCKGGGVVLLEFVNRRSLNRDWDATRLSVGDLKRLLVDCPDVELTDTRGILFFSLTVLNMVPSFLLAAHVAVDRFFSAIMPSLCTRCYVVMRKRA